MEDTHPIRAASGTPTELEPPARQLVSTVAFVGTYTPRQCGIATFTSDLLESSAARYQDRHLFTVAVNDVEDGYPYSPRVRFEIAHDDVDSYRRAADFLNVANVDLVCLQHEFGIYGGPSGSHVLALLAELRMPIVTTLHTILREPEPVQRRITERLCEISDRVVVMSSLGATLLGQVYKVDAGKIDLIFHGIPDLPFVDPNYYKDQFGVEGKLVLLTFGLLSPNKGIETVIRALPRITRRYPDVVYLVLGATHPQVKRHSGEMYRLGLQRLARDVGVEKHVIFHNRFVSREELLDFVAAADIYVTPYLSSGQIVSGTLSYALGAGKPIVSTPYWYAEELLADGRGVLVPFQDAEALAAGVIELLDNEPERHAMRKRAYLKGREMVWPEVAGRYMASFELAKAARTRSPRPVSASKTLEERRGELPPLQLDHLRRLTDSTGLLQHAKFAVPDYGEGYTTDDNARGLVFAMLLEDLEPTKPQEAREQATRYLAFLHHAFNEEQRRFRNFMSFERQWQESCGSEDSHGRALWALGGVIEHSREEGLRGLAATLFDRALAVSGTFTSPRAWAFTLFGIHSYLQHFPGDSNARQMRQELSRRLLDAYRRCRGQDWLWYEDVVSYSNARLPHALLVTGAALEQADLQEVGLETLEWLCSVQGIPEGHFVPIGNLGFYRRGGERARFDQQPIEAHATISACLAAYRITGGRHWFDLAEIVFEWFLGRNDLGVALYDPATGGCRDGLHADRANQNQGAESTLAFGLSLLELKLARQVIDRRGDDLSPDKAA